MKKVILILVLGIFLSGCATYTTKIYSGGDGKIVKADDEQILLGWNGQIWTDDDGNSGYDGPRWRGVESSLNTEKASQHCASKDKFAYFFNDYTAKDHLNPNDAAIFICSSQHLKASSISGQDISISEGWWNNFTEDSLIYKKQVIAEAKEMCKDLGFKIGTDKFAGCAMQVALAKLQPQQSSSSGTTSSSSGSMTIYDPVRDNTEMIRRGQRMLSGACTLGIDCY